MAFRLLVFYIVSLLVVINHFVEYSYSLDFNFTVSLDGLGNFTRVSDAIAKAPNFSTTRFYIHVKPGTYHEHVEVPAQKTFIALIGDDPSTTLIVDNRSNHTGFSTPTSATLTVNGQNFMAKFLTFQNSAGADKGQAVAVFDTANHTAYYKCVFLGYQDTLYAGALPQFFKKCDIYGTVDFIFGDGLAVFQDCNLYARLADARSTVTAQSKANKNDSSGFVFQNCNVTVSPEITSTSSSKDNVTLFLGRPWRDYSTVVFMESFLDGVVPPEGWLDWSSTPLNLLFYAEYNNNGPGADTSRRVTWPGYHVLHNAMEVDKFTVENFIDGNKWLPETGIPFRTGF